VRLGYAEWGKVVHTKEVWRVNSTRNEFLEKVCPPRGEGAVRSLGKNGRKKCFSLGTTGASCGKSRHNAGKGWALRGRLKATGRDGRGQSVAGGGGVFWLYRSIEENTGEKGGCASSLAATGARIGGDLVGFRGREASSFYAKRRGRIAGLNMRSPSVG